MSNSEQVRAELTAEQIVRSVSRPLLEEMALLAVDRLKTMGHTFDGKMQKIKRDAESELRMIPARIEPLPTLEQVAAQMAEALHGLREWHKNEYQSNSQIDATVDAELSGMPLDQAVVRCKWSDAWEAPYSKWVWTRQPQATDTPVNKPTCLSTDGWADVADEVIEAEYKITQRSEGWRVLHDATSHWLEDAFSTRELALEAAKRHYIQRNRPAQPTEVGNSSNNC